jgi:hypothetical protein
MRECDQAIHRVRSLPRAASASRGAVFALHRQLPVLRKHPRQGQFQAKDVECGLDENQDQEDSGEHHDEHDDGDLRSTRTAVLVVAGSPFCFRPGTE